MKKNLSILAGLFLISLSSFSQATANLVIFSEEGDAFYTYINGVKQNEKAETNIKFTGLTPNISLRIQFENNALPQLKKVMALEAGFEHTIRIKRDLKKQLKLGYFGSVPVNEGSPGMTSQQYHTAEDAGSYNTATENIDPSNNSTNVSVTGSTITTNTNPGNTNSENVSINVNMPGVGISMNVNGIDPNATSKNTSISSSTVTNNYSSSTYSDERNTRPNHRKTYSTTTTDNSCRAAMNTTNFNKMKQSVESQSFSDTKMSTAKVATKNSCLSVNQIKEIAKLFFMDDDKLTYAKYAYDHCVDKANYYQVSEVFSFSSTTDELNKFLGQ